MRRTIASLAAVCLVTSACGPGPSASKSAGAAAPQGRYATGTATVVSSDAAGVTLDIDALADLGWPAGRRTIPADAGASAEAVPAAGTPVRFEVFAAGDTVTLTELHNPERMAPPIPR
jgi:Cu/Ag efflux protein CusF